MSLSHVSNNHSFLQNILVCISNKETPVKVGIIILTFTGVLFIINVVNLLTFSKR